MSLQFLTVLFALSTAVAPASGGFLWNRSKSNTPQVLSLRMQRIPTDAKMVRRRAPSGINIETPILNLYSVKLTIGGQELTVQMDTGSSDFIVPSKEFCDEGNNSNGTVCDYGSYSPDDSSTYRSIPGAGPLNASFGDQSRALGEYAIDTLSLGDLDVEGVVIGIGYNMSADFDGGLLGLSYVLAESAIGQQQNVSEAYPNLPVVLAQNGITKSAAYSVFLNSLGTDSGTLLLGGVDTEKYEGNLRTLPVIPNTSGLYDSLQVELSNVSMGGDTVQVSNSSRPVAATLDTGTQFTLLPADVAQFLYEKVNADTTTSDTAMVDCSLRDTGDPIVYNLAGVEISVAMDQVVDDVDDGNGQCPFGVRPLLSNLPDVILGATFLTSAYVVYDLERNQISLAQARYGADSSNIVEIGRGEETVEQAVGDVNAAIKVTTGPGPVLSLIVVAFVSLALM